jgi:hypothetical protein
MSGVERKERAGGEDSLEKQKSIKVAGSLLLRSCPVTKMRSDKYGVEKSRTDFAW